MLYYLCDDKVAKGEGGGGVLLPPSFEICHPSDHSGNTRPPQLEVAANMFVFVFKKFENLNVFSQKCAEKKIIPFRN